MTRQPLSRETWPVWREAYIRVFFADDQDPVQERKFYEQVSAFFRAMVAGAGGSLPKEFSKDPVAWFALGWAYLHGVQDTVDGASRNEQDMAAAEDAARRALALGDPQGIAAYTLAVILIYRSGGPIASARRRATAGNAWRRPRICCTRSHA